MKISLLSFVLVLITTNGFSQTLNDYRNVQSGNWSSSSTWEVYTGLGWSNAASAPATTSNVTIYGGDNVVMDATSTCASLTLTAPGSSGTTSLSVSNGTTLTVSGNVSITGGGNNAKIANLTLAGTGVLDVTGNVTITASNAVRAVLSLGTGSSSLKLGGTITNSGGTLTLTSGTGTVEFKSSLPQTIPANSYYNLTSSGAGTRTLASAGTINVAGTFTPGTNVYTVTGSTVSFNGSSSQTIPAFSYNNLTVTNTGTVSLAGSGTIGIAGTLTPGTATYTTTGSTVDYNGTGSQTIVPLNYYNLTSSNLGARTLSTSGTIQIAGTFASGTNTYTTTSSTVLFNGTSGIQTFSGNIGGVSAHFYNLTANNSGSGLQLSAGTYVDNVLSMSSGYLLLNKQSLTLSNTATSAITRTSGVIVSEDNSTDAFGKANNAGKIVWTLGTVQGAHLIPFGTASGAYIPFTIDFNTGTDIGTYTVGTYPTTTALMKPYPSAVAHVNDNTGSSSDNSSYMVHRFWQIDQSGGVAGFGASLTFTFATGEEPSNTSGGGATANIRAQRWSGNLWQPSLSGQTNPTAYSVTVPGVTQFSPWALSKSISPLPVELLFFRVEQDKASDKVVLKWASASEVNNASYSIEKSTDGVHYKLIRRIEGSGNTSTLVNYEAEDEVSAATRVYYRLIQKDFNGTEKTVGELIAKGKAYTAFGDLLAYSGSSAFSLSFHAAVSLPYKVKVFTALGQEMNSVSGTSTDGDNRIFIPAEALPAGLYIVHLSCGDHAAVVKVVKE